LAEFGDAAQPQFIDDTRMTTTHLTDGASHIVLEPNGGERLRFLGASTLRLKLDRGANDVAFYEYVSEPGVVGPPQHVHHRHDETFYVVDGIYEFTVGHERELLTVGGFIFLPRGTPHTFRNAGDDLGCIVGTISPGRFANYFRELAHVIEATGAPPDADAWTELYGRYDTTFFDSDSG
jgi:mannose-6-phosphate isomerase-like protein (cupin superfamily)